MMSMEQYVEDFNDRMELYQEDRERTFRFVEREVTDMISTAEDIIQYVYKEKPQLTPAQQDCFDYASDYLQTTIQGDGENWRKMCAMRYGKLKEDEIRHLI